MTDCPNAEVRELLPELAAGALDPRERARVEAHLATCAECCAELALLEAIRQAFGRPVPVDVGRIAASLPAPVATAPARGGMVARAGGEDETFAPAIARRRRFRAARWQLAAAVSVFAVGAASIWAVRNGSQGSGGDIDSIGTVVESQERVVTLGHRLGELSDQDLQDLLGALDGIEALPALEPVPLIAPLGGGEGGS